MQALTKTQALDRHALVMTLWLPFGVVAVTLFHYGVSVGGAWFILAGFAMILCAFIGHIIVNAVLRGPFTQAELALGLVLYATGLIALGLATLLGPDFRAHSFLPTCAGFLLIFASVIFYMIVQYGLRRSFDNFDVIRSFSPKAPGPERGRPAK